MENLKFTPDVNWEAESFVYDNLSKSFLFAQHELTKNNKLGDSFYVRESFRFVGRTDRWNFGAIPRKERKQTGKFILWKKYLKA